LTAKDGDTYSSIEEIFTVFTPDLLDKFEEQFIGFCNYKPLTKDLILKDEIINPSYTNSNKVANIEQKRLYNQILNLFLVNKSGINFVSEDVDGKTLAEKQMQTFTSSLKEFLSFDCIIKIGNPGNFDRPLFNSFSNLTEFVPEFDKYTFNPYVKGTLPGDGTNVTLLDSLIQNQDAWKTLRTYVGFSTIPGIDYQNQVQPEFPSISLTTTQPPATYIPPAVGQDTYTFQNICTGDYFNITDPNSVGNNYYTDNDVALLQVVNNSSNNLNFCAKKVPNSALTTTYNLLSINNSPQTNSANIDPETYCLSYYQTTINCQQTSQISPVQFTFVGNSSSIIPYTQNQDNWIYFNIVIPGGGYATF
jgi:hypothetical protein